VSVILFHVPRRYWASTVHHSNTCSGFLTLPVRGHMGEDREGIEQLGADALTTEHLAKLVYRLKRRAAGAVAQVYRPRSSGHPRKPTSAELESASKI
jgi:hypothetical protein